MSPPDKIAPHLRDKNLDELTRRYLAEVAHYQYTTDEIAEVVVRYLRAWQENGYPPNYP
jgi:hypothetical protein